MFLIRINKTYYSCSLTCLSIKEINKNRRKCKRKFGGFAVTIVSAAVCTEHQST